MSSYNAIKQLATETKTKVSDLLAMSSGRDPFYCGQPAQIRDAEWFAAHYDKHGFDHGVHLRRIHYRLISQPVTILMPDGKPYLNTDKHHKWMNDAAIYARTLGLVDVRAFSDHRNPAPIIRYKSEARAARDLMFSSSYGFWLSGIEVDLDAPDFDPPSPQVSGYGYQPGEQPYLMEVWCEKSTINDVLLPICERYNMNLVTAAGFQSITAAVNLIDRAQRTGKPARIFYISDFDPAGDRMPIVVARQIEYWLKNFDLDIDIALNPIALTREQVKKYRLPRIPIKETDLRRANFEDKYGEGAVELDALEAIHPGVMRQIVMDAVSPYWDSALRGRMTEQDNEVRDKIRTKWEGQISDELEELDVLKRRAVKVYRSYREELQDIATRMDRDLEPLVQDAESLKQSLEDQAESFEFSLPDLVESDMEPPDETAWMFRSERDYLTQLDHYRRDAA